MNEADVIFVKNFSYITEDTINLSQLPMMVRRRLNLMEKLAITSMLKIFDDTNVNIIFASKYGEIDRSKKIIEQYTQENTASPTDFMLSVHNTIPSVFSILNKITNAYNSISAGDNSFYAGILDGVMQIESADSLVCYVDSEDKNYAVSLLLSKNPDNYLLKLKFELNSVQTEPDNDFKGFFEGEKTKLSCGIFSLEKVN